MEKKIIPIVLVVLSLTVIPIISYSQSVITWYSLSTNNAQLNFGTNIKMWGEGAVNTTSVLYGKPVNGMIVMLSKTGSPTGNVSIGVWSNTTAPTYDNVVYHLGNISATELTTTPTFYTFENLDETHILSTQQSIGAYHPSSTGANFVKIHSCFINPDGCIDGTNTAVLAYRATGGGWGPPEYNFDVTGSIYLTDGGAPVDPSDDSECPVGTALDCIGDRNTFSLISGAPEISQASNNLLVSLGIVNSTNTDIETNGTGIILMLATGAFFSSITISAISVANNKFGANIQYTNIPKEYWLFLVVGVVALAFYLNWIPDLLFYGMIVGLTGLFSFGLYRHYNGNGG